ncbi:C45 family autoproteolytic acyltransferase/hydolase [Pollutimonas sp. M17]|uniref:C45 family autoproteolytic acyltransferase/hydolase n=1 Tax=Pollutimonas sp. M17 TaxID=2962065 RepID=UPI0021F49295|nr:C45 family peptidase [Pollutimonas sp. M17]UYO94069.1 C45 family peptidase [Pollutimonas sp. M17]
MLKLIELSGSPFQIGQALGRFGAEAAHSYLIESPSWDSVMAWRGSAAAKAMADLTERYFPEVRQELLGLADGLQLPPDDVFLWNCRGDLWSMAPDGCTTVQLPLTGGPRITHNEDGDPGFHGHCGIGLFAPDNGPGFASFIYPASIPGHTFAVTQAGLAMTVNNLRSRQVAIGLPRMVLTRALLNQSSIQDALGVLRGMSRAGGFHLSLAQRGRTELYSVEFNAMGVSAQAVQRAALHANHVIHAGMAGFPQVVTESSRHRQQHGEMLLDGLHTDPLAVLANQSDREFPIYRDAPRDSDNENTMATADIHVGPDRVDWQVYERPGQAARFTLADAALA